MAGLALLACVIALQFVRFGAEPEVARFIPSDPTSSQAAEDLRSAEVESEERLDERVVDSMDGPVQQAVPVATASTPDPVGHVVWGYVLDQSGQPLVDTGWAWLRLVDSMGLAQAAKPDADGAYSASGLANGRWYVSAGASGKRSQEAVLDLTDEVTAVRQDFQLAPQPSVKVRLIAHDGRPFWQAAKDLEVGRFGLEMLAIATRESPGERFEGVRGSPNNQFGVGTLWLNGQSDVRLPLEYMGRIDLHVDPPVHVSLVLYHDVLETQLLDRDQEEVTFSLDPAALPARLGGVELQLIEGSTGAPVPGAQVMLKGKGAAGPQQPTDADGRIRFDGEAPGLRDLWIRAEGRSELKLEVDVPRGRVADLGTLALDVAVPIRGQAVGEDGAGLAVELRVDALPKAGEPLGLDSFRFRSQPDGTFEITTLPAGIWLLQAKDRKDGRVQGNAAELMAPNLVVDTRSGPVAGLHVHLERVSAVVARWTGERPDGLRLRIFDEQGLWRQSSGFSGASPVRIDLLQGTWRLVVSDEAGTPLAERHFTLGEEPVVFELGPDR